MIKKYQKWVKDSPKVNKKIDLLMYYFLGLIGEVGELAEKVKKWKRDETELDIHALKLEIGDIMWYLASISNEFNIDLEEVIHLNIEKLERRAKENKLKGNGDNR